MVDDKRGTLVKHRTAAVVADIDPKDWEYGSDEKKDQEEGHSSHH